MRRLLCLLALGAAAAVAAEPEQPIRLAAPGFRAFRITPEVGTFFSDHFAQQLALHGVQVISSGEVATLVGMERQRQLMGCGDESLSCAAELAGALGADGVVTGSLGRIGHTLQANIKILSSHDGRVLAVVSRFAQSEEELLRALTDGAATAADQLLARLRPQAAAAREEDRRIAERVELPNVITLGAMQALLGIYELEYERGLNHRFGLFARASWIAPDLHVYGYGIAGQLTAGLRVYPWADAPAGMWIAAEVKGGYGEMPDIGQGPTGRSPGKGPFAAFSGSFGYTFLFWNRVVLSVGVGTGWYFTEPWVGYSPSDSGNEVFFRSQVGVAF